MQIAVVRIREAYRTSHGPLHVRKVVKGKVLLLVQQGHFQGLEGQCGSRSQMERFCTLYHRIWGLTMTLLEAIEYKLGATHSIFTVRIR